MYESSLSALYFLVLLSLFWFSGMQIESHVETGRLRTAVFGSHHSSAGCASCFPPLPFPFPFFHRCLRWPFSRSGGRGARNGCCSVKQLWFWYRCGAAEALARDNDVVLTTFTKLSSEYQSTTGRRLSGKGAASCQGVSLLQQVHWQRVILDEGHMLGQSLCMTSKLAMAMMLRSGSRWVMTGTPTPRYRSGRSRSFLLGLLAVFSLLFIVLSIRRLHFF